MEAVVLKFNLAQTEAVKSQTLQEAVVVQPTHSDSIEEQQAKESDENTGEQKQLLVEILLTLSLLYIYEYALKQILTDEASI